MVQQGHDRTKPQEQLLPSLRRGLKSEQLCVGIKTGPTWNPAAAAFALWLEGSCSPSLSFHLPHL